MTGVAGAFNLRVALRTVKHGIGIEELIKQRDDLMSIIKEKDEIIKEQARYINIYKELIDEYRAKK